MKSLTLSLAILASSMALATVSLDAGADQLLQTKSVKQLNVRTAAEVKKVFGIAAAAGGRQAIEISCSPADSDWCAKDFVTACDNAKGGMSTGPDGGVTCSLPQYN
jgi:hypothetical protein